MEKQIMLVIIMEHALVLINVTVEMDGVEMSVRYKLVKI
jgi:hypothetical protein